MKRLALLSVLALLAAPSLFAAGFALYEGSSRGNALGGLTATADDASAIFYNPAGLTQLEGRHFMIGATLISPSAKITATNSAYDGSTQATDYENNIFTPPHIYFTYQVNKRLFLGAGVYTRFGLGTEYENAADWYGRYSNTDTVIETISFAGNAAYKVNDKISLGFGIVYHYIHADLNQAIDANRLLLNPSNDPTTSDADVFQQLEGDDTSWGFNLSIQIKPDDRWSLGLMYNSEIEHKLDGSARFEKPAGLPQTFFVDTNVNTDPIDLPFMLFLAAAYQANEKLNVTFGAVQTGWSSIEVLKFNYQTPIVVIPALGVTVNDAQRDLRWSDVWRWSIGFDHTINEKMHFMWGFTFDESPLPDDTISYLLPANDRQLVNLGVTYQMGVWQLAASYNYLTLSDRDIVGRQLADGVLDGEVTDGGAHLLGFTLSRGF